MFAMADCIRENFAIACRLISDFNEEDAAKLEENEDFIDKCESSLNNFLLKVTSQNNMSRSERLAVSELLNSLSDMERIGDHCENLLVVSRNIIDQKINFSDQGMNEIHDNLYGRHVCDSISYHFAGICMYHDLKLYPWYHGEGFTADEYVCGRYADEDYGWIC